MDVSELLLKVFSLNEQWLQFASLNLCPREHSKANGLNWFIQWLIDSWVTIKNGRVFRLGWCPQKFNCGALEQYRVKSCSYRRWFETFPAPCSIDQGAMNSTQSLVMINTYSFTRPPTTSMQAIEPKMPAGDDTWIGLQEPSLCQPLGLRTITETNNSLTKPCLGCTWSQNASSRKSPQTMYN